MKKLVKTLLYASVGAIATATHKMNEELERLKTDGKVSTQEGKDLLEHLNKNEDFIFF